MVGRDPLPKKEIGHLLSNGDMKAVLSLFSRSINLFFNEGYDAGTKLIYGVFWGPVMRKPIVNLNLRNFAVRVSLKRTLLII
jgi:hypothetical protein